MDKPNLTSRMETIIKFKESERLQKKGHGALFASGASKYGRHRVPVIQHDNNDTSTAPESETDVDMDAETLDPDPRFSPTPQASLSPPPQAQFSLPPSPSSPTLSKSLHSPPTPTKGKTIKGTNNFVCI